MTVIPKTNIMLGVTEGERLVTTDILRFYGRTPCFMVQRTNLTLEATLTMTRTKFLFRLTVKQEK
ncbi:hypothetical protein CI610_02730 [invertebrate metagenome]|uniref:Uncharacterized protein n=1 Tax=invertebrate metagenome TaxID=1711999 RepID=A0A2H9T537_9ZZZZ